MPLLSLPRQPSLYDLALRRMQAGEAARMIEEWERS